MTSNQPVTKLNNGMLMPTVIFGTWKIPAALAEQAVENALAVGYKHIDCAAVYGNEVAIGGAFSRVFKEEKVKREDIFITSKLWNTCHKPEHVLPALEKTLKDLQLDYLDLYLMHWPVAFEYTTPQLSPAIPRDSQDKIIFGKVSLQETWQAMEDLLNTGKVRAIGVSNFPTITLLDLLSRAKVKPVVNQVEIHPYLTHDRLIQGCDYVDVHVTAYSILGSGAEGPLQDPVVVQIANKHNKTPAQVLIRWALERGVSVIAKSTHAERIRENFQIFDFKLTAEEVKAISALDRRQSLVDTLAYWRFPVDV